MTRDRGVLVLRTSRPASFLLLLLSGFLLVGLVAALAGAATGGGRFVIDGTPSGPAVTVVLWLLLLPLMLLLAVAVVVLLRSIVAPRTQVLSPAGYRLERRGRVEADMPLEDLTGIRFRPAARATWQASDSSDRSLGISRVRLHPRIELRSRQAVVELTDAHSWPAQVDLVRGWVRARPEILDDDDASRALLLAPAGHPPVHEDGPLPRWPLGLVRLAVRRRDAWAPFLPDSYGQYSALFNGRYTGARAPRRGSTLGLVVRWGFLALWFVPALVLVWVVARALLALA